MEVADPFDLERFVSAQAAIFATAIGELEAGRKRSHWMWFVFPQWRGLGRSAMAEFYGIGSLDEARAYLADSRLGPRLRLCAETVFAIEGRSVHDIFGAPDDMKFRSSMTLFDRADAGIGNPFRRALDRLCGGSADEATLSWLDQAGNGR